MRPVRFVRGERVGPRCYLAGETAGVPDRDADRLVATGAAVEVEPSSPSVDPAGEAPGAAPAARRDHKPGKWGKKWRR